MGSIHPKVRAGAIAGALATLATWSYRALFPHGPPLTPDAVGAAATLAGAIAGYFTSSQEA